MWRGDSVTLTDCLPAQVAFYCYSRAGAVAAGRDCQAVSLSCVMISHVLTIIVKTVQPHIWVIMLTV